MRDTLSPELRRAASDRLWRFLLAPVAEPIEQKEAAASNQLAAAGAEVRGAGASTSK